MTTTVDNQNYQWKPLPGATNGDEQTYQQTELVAVQGATIGSAPVRYDTAMAQQAELIRLNNNNNTEIKAMASVTPPGLEHAVAPYMTIAETTPTNLSSPPKSTDTKSDELCRDYLNGRCGRDGCKYKHDIGLRDSIRSKVCKDYQNAKCLRTKCKYLHLTEAEHEEYRRTGIMPTKPDSVECVDPSAPDICRDYLKGLCGRGNKCRYSHVMSTASLGAAAAAAADVAGLGTVSISLGKRSYSAMSGSILTLPAAALVNPIELNEQLKHKLIKLRKQVLELTQLNDALYHENMKLRHQTPGNSTSERASLLEAPTSQITCTQITSPSITQNTSPNITQNTIQNTTATTQIVNGINGSSEH